jgi:hypothetical protein
MVINAKTSEKRLWSSGNYNFQRLQKPQVKQAANEVACSSDRTVLAADPYVAIELAYYLPQCNIHFYSDAAELQGGYAPLSGSRLQIKNITELQGAKLTYIYYDEPKITIAPELQQTELHSFGPLHVASYTAK